MRGRWRTIARATNGTPIPAFRRSYPASDRPAERRSHRRDTTTTHRAAPACGRHSAQYSGSRRTGSIGIAVASPSGMIGAATATSGGNGASARGTTGPGAATTCVVDPGKPAAAMCTTAGCGTPRHASEAVRTIGVSIEDKSREALRAPLPRRSRVMKPCRLLASAGIRAGGVPARLPARITRSGPRPRATCTRNAPEPACVVRRGRLPLRGQRRLAISMRSARPASRLTARRTREHRGGASLGAGRASVKKAAERMPGARGERAAGVYSRQEAGVLRLETLQMSECALFRAKMLGL